MLGFIKALLKGEAPTAPPLTPPSFTKPCLPDEDSPAISQPAPSDEDHPLSGRALIIDYVDNQGSSSFRRISVRNCYSSGENAYVAARCLERQAPRVFRIDRIDAVSCGVTGEDLGEPEDFFVPTPKLNRSQSTNRPGRKPLAHPELRAALRVLVTIARADGYLHPSEKQVIQSFLRAAAPLLAEHEREEMLHRALGLAADFDVFLRNIKIVFQAGEPLASTVLIAIGDLARADGEVSDEEFMLVTDLVHIGKAYDYRVTLE